VLSNKGTERYDGRFKDDKPHGKGVWVYAGGGRYVGDFKEGFSDGQVCMCVVCVCVVCVYVVYVVCVCCVCVYVVYVVCVCM